MMKVKSIHPLATLNAPTNRGGRIASVSTSIVIDGWAIAAVGDKVACPVDGETTIVTGCDSLRYRGIPVAIAGSKTASGATIVGSMQTRSALVIWEDGSATLTGEADRLQLDDQ